MSSKSNNSNVNGRAKRKKNGTGSESLSWYAIPEDTSAPFCQWLILESWLEVRISSRYFEASKTRCQVAVGHQVKG